MGTPSKFVTFIRNGIPCFVSTSYKDTRRKEEKGIFKDVAKVNPASLDLVFNPRTVALIGASENELKSGGMFLNSFIDCGLKKRVVLG